jgi:hypothetical protein
MEMLGDRWVTDRSRHDAAGLRTYKTPLECYGGGLGCGNVGLAGKNYAFPHAVVRRLPANGRNAEGPGRLLQPTRLC